MRRCIGTQNSKSNYKRIHNSNSTNAHTQTGHQTLDTHRQFGIRHSKQLRFSFWIHVQILKFVWMESFIGFCQTMQMMTDEWWVASGFSIFQNKFVCRRFSLFGHRSNVIIRPRREYQFLQHSAFHFIVFCGGIGNTLTFEVLKCLETSEFVCEFTQLICRIQNSFDRWLVTGDW